MRYEADCLLWAYPGKATWYFATLPAHLTEPLKAVRGPSSGWGSIRVEATIGGSTWKTSIFPDSKSGSFLLPVKAQVRRQEGISAGDRARVIVEIAL